MTSSVTRRAHHLLPLGALAAGLGFASQPWAQDAAPTLPTVSTHATRLPAEQTELKVEQTRIGKGVQDLRDIPQSVTVVTEKLMDDRQLETVKAALKNTGGVTFLAAEGGEEDVRLRGFSLAQTGDLFVDGMRDPAVYDRDTFNLDRVEVLRGSASMLFGRGSTGGAVNQVSKPPRLMDRKEVGASITSEQDLRLTADVNLKTGDDAAARVNIMGQRAANDGQGNRLNKYGLAGSYRWGIGHSDEWLVSAFHLNNNNGVNYGLPWIKPSANAPASASTILPVAADSYYGLASDRNHGSATWLAGSHVHRFDSDTELRSQIRVGRFSRDLRPSTIRLCRQTTNGQGVTSNPECSKELTTLENFSGKSIFTRGTPIKNQDFSSIDMQSDYSTALTLGPWRHSITAGVDAALEKKTVNSSLDNLSKPKTNAGAPNDGASIDEATRRFYRSSNYTSRSLGLYAQDVVEITPQWKVLGGLRYDKLSGDYQSHANPNNASSSASAYRMNLGEWSQRAGVLFQPDARQSYHFSYGTSFNSSGDAYSLGASNVDTPPEQSRNLELGAKLTSNDGRFSTRLALFHATKFNERNTDPLLTLPGTNTPLITLSGQRHVAGFEVDFAGRLNPDWEVYASYMWMPKAEVDKAAPCPASQPSCPQGAVGERQGDRPALTPRHSGTVWSTYQVSSQWRLGAGLNWRSMQRPTRSEIEVPAHVTADVMAEYTIQPEWTVKAAVNNISNARYADALYPGHYIPGAARRFSLSTAYRF